MTGPTDFAEAGGPIARGVPWRTLLGKHPRGCFRERGQGAVMTKTMPDLGALAVRLREAREAVAEHRHGPVGSEAAVGSRRLMLQALQDYIGALESMRLPVPYALRDELRLHEQLFTR